MADAIDGGHVCTIDWSTPVPQINGSTRHCMFEFVRIF